MLLAYLDGKIDQEGVIRSSAEKRALHNSFGDKHFGGKSREPKITVGRTSLRAYIPNVAGKSS